MVLTDHSCQITSHFHISYTDWSGFTNCTRHNIISMIILKLKFMFETHVEYPYSTTKY